MNSPLGESYCKKSCNKNKKSTKSLIKKTSLIRKLTLAILCASSLYSLDSEGVLIPSPPPPPALTQGANSQKRSNLILTATGRNNVSIRELRELAKKQYRVISNFAFNDRYAVTSNLIQKLPSSLRNEFEPLFSANLKKNKQEILAGKDELKSFLEESRGFSSSDAQYISSLDYYIDDKAMYELEELKQRIDTFLNEGFNHKQIVPLMKSNLSSEFLISKVEISRDNLVRFLELQNDSLSGSRKDIEAQFENELNCFLNEASEFGTEKVFSRLEHKRRLESGRGSFAERGDMLSRVIKASPDADIKNGLHGIKVVNSSARHQAQEFSSDNLPPHLITQSSQFLNYMKGFVEQASAERLNIEESKVIDSPVNNINQVTQVAPPPPLTRSIAPTSPAEVKSTLMEIANYLDKLKQIAGNYLVDRTARQRFNEMLGKNKLVIEEAINYRHKGVIVKRAASSEEKVYEGYIIPAVHKLAEAERIRLNLQSKGFPSDFASDVVSIKPEWINEKDIIAFQESKFSNQGSMFLVSSAMGHEDTKELQRRYNFSNNEILSFASNLKDSFGQYRANQLTEQEKDKRLKTLKERYDLCLKASEILSKEELGQESVGINVAALAHLSRYSASPLKYKDFLESKINANLNSAKPVISNILSSDRVKQSFTQRQRVEIYNIFSALEMLKPAEYNDILGLDPKEFDEAIKRIINSELASLPDVFLAGRLDDKVENKTQNKAGFAPAPQGETRHNSRFSRPSIEVIEKNNALAAELHNTLTLVKTNIESNKSIGEGILHSVNMNTEVETSTQGLEADTPELQPLEIIPANTAGAEPGKIYIEEVSVKEEIAGDTEQSDYRLDPDELELYEVYSLFSVTEQEEGGDNVVNDEDNEDQVVTFHEEGMNNQMQLSGPEQVSEQGLAPELEQVETANINIKELEQCQLMQGMKQEEKAASSLRLEDNQISQAAKVLKAEQQLLQKEYIKHNLKVNNKHLTANFNLITSVIESRVLEIDRTKPAAFKVEGIEGVGAGEIEGRRPSSIWSQYATLSSKYDKGQDFVSSKSLSKAYVVGIDYNLNEKLMVGAAGSRVLTKAKFTLEASASVMKAYGYAWGLYAKYLLTENMALSGIFNSLNLKTSVAHSSSIPSSVTPVAYPKGMGHRAQLSLARRVDLLKGVILNGATSVSYSKFKLKGYRVRIEDEVFQIKNRVSKELDLEVGASILFPFIHQNNSILTPRIGASIKHPICSSMNDAKVSILGAGEHIEAKGTGSTSGNEYMAEAGINYAKGPIEIDLSTQAAFAKRHLVKMGFIKVKINF